MRHRRLLHEIPEDERAKRHNGGGQCAPPGRRVDPRQAIAEEQAYQTPEQPGDADGLSVRIRRAVGGHGVSARGERLRDPIADGEKRCPRQAWPDRPRSLGMAGRSGREEVGLVAEPEQAIVVGQIVVAVEPQRSQVREVVEPVTLQPRPETELRHHPARKRQQEHRRDRPIRLPRPGRMQGPQRGGGCGHRHDQHARRLERHAGGGQQRCPRHGLSRQVDATQDGDREGAPIASGCGSSVGLAHGGLVDGRRSSRTKKGPVRTRPKSHTSSVISAVTPLSA